MQKAVSTHIIEDFILLRISQTELIQVGPDLIPSN